MLTYLHVQPWFSWVEPWLRRYRLNMHPIQYQLCLSQRSTMFRAYVSSLAGMQAYYTTPSTA